MDVKRIKNMGRELNTFLAEFDDCFARSESRERLRNVLNPDEIKYFVSNMTAGPGGHVGVDVVGGVFTLAYRAML